MPTKMTGVEFKRFYSDEAYWGDCWHEGTCILVDGVDTGGRVV